MSKKYYTLLVLVRDSWSPEFGDYDREVVDDEAEDYRDQDLKVKVICTSEDQASINARVAAENAKLPKPAPRVPVIHLFDDSGEAYDATQIGVNTRTGDVVVDGDLLFIPAEGVLGVSWTWPFAVTPDCGNLHQVLEPASLDESEPHLVPSIELARKLLEI